MEPKISNNDSYTVDAHERPKRDFLTQTELDQLLNVAKKGRHGVRDYCIILIMVRHALRVSELCRMRVSDIDLETGRIFIARLKNSLSTEQPLAGDEKRALRAWLRVREENKIFANELFVNQQRSPLDRKSLFVQFGRLGLKANLTIKVTPHILRHTTGFLLANKGIDSRTLQDFMGHRNPSNTARYTRVASKRFENLWDR